MMAKKKKKKKKKEKDFFAECIGKRIRLRRSSQRITQAKLAELSNVSTKFIGEVERGEVTPSIPYLFKIVVGLGEDPDFLYKEIKSDIFLLIEEEVKRNRPE